MTNNIFQSEVIEMKSLNNLFIEMSPKSCNQRCKHCYISFPKYKKEENYISIENIKHALNDTTKDDLECIYLTGAEPMMHPDFNSILRLCLKRCDVCICTNGSFINEKKARFLKKVENESDREIIFKISLDHYDEVKNDDIRYRGAFRHAIFAIKHLIKYNFDPIIVCTNYYGLDENELIEGIYSIMLRNNFETDKSHIQINPYHSETLSGDNKINPDKDFKPDCQNSRILTSTGVYTCPFLANDYRGRCGSNFSDYTKKSQLETSFCNTCLKAKTPMFSIDFSKYI